ncbi:MAG: hypothetical protein AB1458_01780 [Bacteroidota bacterium]
MYKLGKKEEKLEGAVVTLYETGKQIQQKITGKNGKYDLVLLPDKEYEVVYSKAGYVSKKITVNTRNVPPDRAKYGFSPQPIDIVLFEKPTKPEVSAKVESILSKPIGKFYYDPKQQDFGWEKTYTKSIQDEMEELQKIQEQLEKEEELKAQQQAQQQQELQAMQAKYDLAIQTADKLFQAKDYVNAKKYYSEALTYKPEQQYPKDQIALCDKLQAEKDLLAQNEQKYKDLVAQADKLFKEQSYQQARNAYTEANNLKPGEQYPKDQIAKIDKLMADQKEIEEKYKKLIADGDKSFNGKLYTFAKGSYEEALKLKPNEQYPKDQLKKIDDAMKAAEEQKYKDAIAKADKLFSAKDYTNAKTEYQNALVYKPAEQYPKDQIALCDKNLKDIEGQKVIDQKYKDAIAAADKLFNVKDYKNAKAGYEAALKIKPEEQYPKDQIAKCDKFLSDLEAEKLREQQYKDALAKADKFFAAKDYANAKSAYQDALGIKAGEKYPTDQIALCDKYIGDMEANKQKEQQYKDLIAKADGEFNAKSYADAKNTYNEALKIKSAEKYPKDQIAKIDAILKGIENDKLKEQQYKDAIAKADKFFEAKDYKNAKLNYQSALTIKAGEKYPADQIALCDKLLGEQEAEKLKEQQYKDAIAKADKFFAAKDYANAKMNYETALTIKKGEKYPTDQIELCNKYQGDIEANKLKEQQYKDAIAKADKLFTAKDYVNARSAYQDALGIKAGEKYPTDQIALCDKYIGDMEANKKKEEQYKELISKADSEFGGKNYQDAKNTYSEALKIKPAEKYPKDQIAKIDGILKGIESDKLKEQQYKDAIAKADKFFESKDYKNAKLSYQSALTIKAGEKYPADQIALCDKYLGDIEAEKLKEQQYKDAIAKADKFFAAKDYANAKAGYQAALGIKAGEKYPTDQIALCDKFLGDLEASKLKEQQYKDAIAKADKLFSAKDYTNAKSAYQDALGIKAGEKYPTDQIALCNKYLADIEANKLKDAEREQKYKQAIASGDQNFNSTEYETAKKFYQEALTYKPAEKYPKDKIAECDKLMAEKIKNSSLMQKYNDAIAKADKLFTAKDYKGAKTGYEGALKIKADEQYPKDQIALCDKYMNDAANEKLNAQKYKEAIARADKQFAANDYQNARNTYNEALGYKPEEQYPKDQIAKIDKILADKQAELDKIAKEKELNDKYVAAVNAGDKFFAAKDYINAKSKYQEALGYFPSQLYPKTQIEKCDKFITADVTLEKYSKIVLAADQAFKEKKYDEAKLLYQEALTVRAGEKYPKDKIAEIELLMKEAQLTAQKDAQLKKYYELVKQGEELMGKKDYVKARIKFKEALALQPGEQHPKDRIAQIDAFLNDKKPIKDTVKTVVQVDKETEAKKRFEELKQKYGPGVTDLGNNIAGSKTIYTFAVVTDTSGDIYKKIVYNWGQAFYYKNDDIITEAEFATATASAQ